MRLDRYEVGEEIGSGASARVCRGFDTELKRDVAVKIMHAHLRGKGAFAERFRREAQAVAALQHPNIVRIYDVAPEKATELYFVAELMEGGTVADLLAAQPEGKIPHEIALAVALQVLRGLEAAHRAGVVHRDLKPENLMLTRDGYVKIADFGIARVETDAELTQTGSLMGSPAYMAPEQVEGKPIDARADLFSFGVVLYRMVTGKSPFGEGSVVQILQRIAKGEHTPVRDLETSLDPRIAELVELCLALEPEQRPASARDARERLAHVAQLREIGDPAEEIAAFLQAEPEAAKRREYAIVESLVKEARALLERKTDPGLAMALVDRALEIQPFHFEAYRLLQQSGPNRRKKVSLFVGLFVVLLLLMVGGWLVVQSLEPDKQATGSLATAPAAASLPPPAALTIPAATASPAPTEAAKVAPPAQPARAAVERAPDLRPRTAENAHGVVILITRPWADVYVDDESEKAGTTPLLRELKLSAGKHTLRLMNPHAHFVQVEVDVAPGEHMQKIVELPLLPGLLQVQAAADEQVYVDGKLVPRDKLVEPLQMPHGEHAVRFVRAGQRREENVEVIAGRQVEVRSPFLD